MLSVRPSKRTKSLPIITLPVLLININLFATKFDFLLDHDEQRVLILTLALFYND